MLWRQIFRTQRKSLPYTTKKEREEEDKEIYTSYSLIFWLTGAISYRNNKLKSSRKSERERKKTVAYDKETMPVTGRKVTGTTRSDRHTIPRRKKGILQLGRMMDKADKELPR